MDTIIVSLVPGPTQIDVGCQRFDRIDRKPYVFPSKARQWSDKAQHLIGNMTRQDSDFNQSSKAAVKRTRELSVCHISPGNLESIARETRATFQMTFLDTA